MRDLNMRYCVHQEDGQALVEYALIFALIVLVVLVFFRTSIADKIIMIYTKIIDQITTATP